MLELVKVDYQGQPLSFSEDGWFNATQAAERFGKRPVDWLRLDETQEYITVLRSLLNEGQESHFKCEPGSHLNTSKVRDLVRTRRGKYRGGTWLHPKLAVSFARWLDVRFAVWCDLQIDFLIRGKHPHFDWKRSRHASSASFKVMTDVLLMARQRLGKTCAPHHFSNEARLINYALTGQFGKVERDGLGKGDLDLLAKLENLNTVLIGCGASYQERKAELERYAEEQRAPLMIEASV